ncbi:MAG: hypothetical protein ACR2NR_02665, partial [Solirubrobacteraceae bacterium]
MRSGSADSAPDADRCVENGHENVQQRHLRPSALHRQGSPLRGALGALLAATTEAPVSVCALFAPDPTGSSQLISLSALSGFIVARPKRLVGEVE